MSTLKTARDILAGRVTLTNPGAMQRRSMSSLGPIAYRGGSLALESQERHWSSSAVVYRAVSLIAQNLAAQNLTVDVAGELRDDHPVAQLYNEGAAGQPVSARVVREVAFARAELTGQAFIYVDRGPDGTGQPTGMHVLYDTVRPVTGIRADLEAVGGPLSLPDTYGRERAGLMTGVLGYIVDRADGTRTALLESEVLWLRYPDPLTEWGALAPWRAALYASESDSYARAWQRSEFKNNARPSGVIGLGDVSMDVYERALAEIRTRMDGPANASKTLVVAGATSPKYERFSMTPEEMSYLDSRTANADEIFLAFGVSPDLFRPGSTFDNRKQAKEALWSETLLPKMDVLASEIDRQLLPERGYQAAYDLSEIDALRDSQDSVVKRAGMAVTGDIATIDEGRAMMGLEPLPDGLGAVTLTPYRARATAVVASEYSTVIAPDAGAARSRVLRYAGATRVRTAISITRVQQQRKVSPQAKIIAAYDRHERAGRKAVSALAERQVKDVIRNLKKGRLKPVAPSERAWPTRTVGQATAVTIPTGTRAAADDLFDTVYWTAETAKALEAFLDGVWTEGGQRIAIQLGIPFGDVDSPVLAAMRARLDVLADQVTSTTRDVIQSDVLAAGVEEGESIDDLAARLTESFRGLSTWRAEMIARTETIGGYNGASQTAAEEIGIEMGKRWLATEDHRTRPSHADMDGYTVALGGKFPNGCSYPGDPSGPADETVNCRCTTLYDETWDGTEGIQ